MVPGTHRRRRVVASGLAAVTAVGVVTLLLPAPALAADAVELGTAANFSVLGASAVTNTGPSDVEQLVGVSPGTAIDGFPPGTYPGELHQNDTVAQEAHDDLVDAYAATTTVPVDAIIATELGDTTVSPGTYTSLSGTFEITGKLILDGAGVYIFRTASTLVTASDSEIELINGATARNVFWQVGSSATLGTGTAFVGTIMASASVILTTGVNLDGRALAINGAVTLDTAIITDPAAAAPPTPSPSPTPVGSPPPDGPPPPDVTPPVDPPFDGPGRPSLPETGGGRDGGGAVWTLAVAGTAMVLLGGLLMVIYRRRWGRSRI